MSGSSIGAIVGALYAAGITPKMMEGIAQNLDIARYYDVSSPYRFIREKNRDLIKLLTQNKDFSELKIPLITAVDLTYKLIEISEGKVYEAVRASISITGILLLLSG